MVDFDRNEYAGKLVEAETEEEKKAIRAGDQLRLESGLCPVLRNTLVIMPSDHTFTFRN